MRCSRCEISVSVSPSSSAEDFENRLERAVAARAVQPQLVAEAALLREPAVGRHQRGQRADRVAAARSAVLAHCRELVGRARARTRAGRRRAPDGARKIVGFVRRVVRPAPASAGVGPRISSVSSAVSAGMWITSKRDESIAQQPQRARDVAARQHEPVAARRDAVDEFVQDAAQARETLERPELEELVEAETSPARCRRLRARAKNASVASNAARAPAARRRTRRRPGTATRR